MSSALIFDVNNFTVLQYRPSNEDPAAYQGRTDVLIDANLSAVQGLPMIYWKVSNGSVVAMSSAEQAAVNAAIVAAALASQRSGATGFLTSQDALGEVVRAIGSVQVDEINLLREWIESFKAAVAASTSLANMQTRVAALPAMPDRTLAQYKTAITNKVSGGSVDS